MVSQKFMVILNQQPHYSNVSTTSTSSIASNDVSYPSQRIKEEYDSDVTTTSNTSCDLIDTDSTVLEPRLMIKEENDRDVTTTPYTNNILSKIDSNVFKNDVTTTSNTNHDSLDTDSTVFKPRSMIKEENDSDLTMTPNTYSASKIDNSLLEPLLTIKVENDSDVTTTPNTNNIPSKIDRNVFESDLTTTPNTYSPSKVDSSLLKPLPTIKEKTGVVMKEEKEDVIIKEEIEDNSDDWHPSDPQTEKSSAKEHTLPPSNETPKIDKGSLSTSYISLQQFKKDKQALRSPSKRIRKEKIIFDPSNSSNMQRKKICNETDDITYISEPEESEPAWLETPTEDIMNNFKGEWDGELVCKFCGKIMQRLDYLRLHLMKHTGEKPHKCPFCENGYRARWRLAQHVRTHTKNLPYHCPYCNYRGNRSDYLTSHIKRIHKNQAIKKGIDKDNGIEIKEIV